MIFISKLLCLLLLLGVTLCCNFVSPTAGASSSSYREEVSLSFGEKHALDKFKVMVIPRIPPSSYIHRYKNEDLYFIRWLRARNLDVVAAEEMFMAHMAWRADNNVDTIDQEHWSQFEKEYPFFDDTFDKQGPPAIEQFFPYWNIRKAVLSGNGKQLNRWVVLKLERAQRRLFAARAEGKEVAQTVILSSIGGLNLTAQACPACLPFYGKGAALLDAHYPFLFKDVYCLDAPRSFEMIWRVVKSFLTPATRNSWHVYSKQAEWVKVLDKEFDKSQRSTLFGGTIQRDF